MQLFTKKVLSAALLLFSVSSVVPAADNPSSGNPAGDNPLRDTISTHNVSEVVITATKTATPLYEVGGSITLLTEKDLLASRKVYISEVLREVAGINIVQQGGPGRLTRVYTRGGSPHHTLILVDGIEMTDPGSVSNAYDISSLQTEDVERVEILRGPQSTLYGSDALSGVISIFTKKGAQDRRLSMSAEGGSYGTYRGSAGLRGTAGIMNYSLLYSGLYTSGFSTTPEKYGNNEKDSHQNNSYRARAGFQLMDNLNLNALAGYTATKTGLDQNSRTGDDPNFSIKNRELTLKAGIEQSLLDNTYENNISVSLFKNISSAIDEPDQIRPTTSSNAYFAGQKVKAEWQNNLRLFEGNTFTLGAEYELEKATTSYKATGDWESDNYFPVHKAITRGIYVQDQINLFSSLFGSFGVRYDRHSRFGDVVTYRAAPAFLLNATDTKFKFTYGTGFKSPSLYYLFDPMYGNQDLKPEKSEGIDAGIEQYLFNYRVTLGVTLFRNRFTDLMGYDPATFKTINIARAETKGVELTFLTAPVKGVSFRMNYTYTDAIDKSGNSDRTLIRRPRNKVSAVLNYEDKKSSVSLEVVNTGKREDDDFSGYPTQRIELKEYTLVNIGASYRLNKYIELTGRIDNLLNEEYEEVIYYATPRRSAYAGIRLVF